MAKIQSVAVFCGSRPGHDPAYRAAATELGHGLAAAGIKLVYGGGKGGMMGAVTDAVLAGGGKVKGVIPEFLTRLEVAHEGVTDMTITDTMHVRKRLMFDAADAFVIMPGGLGTLDETAEIVTWRQLSLHDKPILIVDIQGWAQPVARVLEFFIETGFAAAETRRLYQVVPDVPAVLSTLTRDAG
jgi:uncharacterized protein (TIGR00730 family)